MSTRQIKVTHLCDVLSASQPQGLIDALLHIWVFLQWTRMRACENKCCNVVHIGPMRCGSGVTTEVSSRKAHTGVKWLTDFPHHPGISWETGSLGPWVPPLGRCAGGLFDRARHSTTQVNGSSGPTLGPQTLNTLNKGRNTLIQKRFRPKPFQASAKGKGGVPEGWGPRSEGWP